MKTQMLNASNCPASDDMLIHVEQKSICKQSKVKTPCRKNLKNENEFLTNQTNKRRSHEINGGDTSNQVDKENKN